MQSLGLLLHGAAALLKREFERAARPHRLTHLQWRVLAELDREDGLTQSALGARLDARPMSISDVAERLEAAGLVAREADPADSRAKRMTLRPEGQALVARMRGLAAGVYARALDGIDAADREAMTRALERIVANLEDTDGRDDP